MHTNFDALARLKMDEHQAWATKAALQRQAREARRGAGATDPAHWLRSARTRALPIMAAGAAAAFALLVR